MRDVVVLLIVLGATPFILGRAWIGILVWSWLSYMNPHRLTWGFAYSFPFAQFVAIVTIIALFFDKTPKRLPATSLMFVWGALILWMNVSTLTAIYPEAAAWEWDRTMKIMFVSLLTVMLIDTRKKLTAFIWVVALSVAFFGVKGGIFSLLGGGQSLVWGPPGSFFEDNNALGLVLVMTTPLLFYLSTLLKRPLFRWAMFAVMGFTALSVLGTHSRGALLAASAMVGMLWLKSPYKARTGIALLLLVPVLLYFMPDEWWERMQTIRSFREDSSAMGRINAWGFAINLALDRPLTGGGFQVFRPELFLRYAPEPLDFHDAHSIYFEMLAEHGFVGLGLFLALGLATLHTAARIVRRTRPHEELAWARVLASMIQVALCGYAVGGAFLGLAYFDLFYHLVAIIMITNKLVEARLAELEGHKSRPWDGRERRRRRRSDRKDTTTSPAPAPAPTTAAVTQRVS